MTEPITQQITITIRCRLAWWLRPTIWALRGWVILTGHLPSDAFIERLAMRAAKTDVIDAKRVEVEL